MVTFHDTLYDEDVGCHVAWGHGFTFCLIDGGVPLIREDAWALG